METDEHRVRAMVVLRIEEEKYPHQLILGVVARLNIGTVRLGQTQKMYEISYVTTLQMVVVVDQQVGVRVVPFINQVQGTDENAGVRVCDSHRCTSHLYVSNLIIIA